MLGRGVLLVICLNSLAEAFHCPARLSLGYDKIDVHVATRLPAMALSTTRRGRGAIAVTTMMGQNDKKEQDLASLAAKLQVIPRADRSSVLLGAVISLDAIVFVFCICMCHV